MNAIEFYTFEKEVRCRLADGTDSKLTENNRDVVLYATERIEKFYPKAYSKLQAIYKKRLPNIPFFQYGIVERFVRCNFGAIDNVSDIDNTGRFNLEHVNCPLRGICDNEDIICNPEFDTKISDSEMRVLELLYNGCDKEYIADKLCLSPHTVNNHIRNAYNRLGFREKAEFIDYAHRNKLFKN